MLPLDEFKRLFHVRSLPGEKARGFQTVGGFVMSCLQSVPSVGNTFDEGELRYEVIDMDGHRVDKVLVVSLEVEDGKGEMRHK
jgi:putative hemolysin